MYNYIFEGQQSYSNETISNLIQNSNKKEFRAFEWESIPSRSGVGLATKIRMVTVSEKEIIPTTNWREG